MSVIFGRRYWKSTPGGTTCFLIKWTKSLRSLISTCEKVLLTHFPPTLWNIHNVTNRDHFKPIWMCTFKDNSDKWVIFRIWFSISKRHLKRQQMQRFKGRLLSQRSEISLRSICQGKIKKHRKQSAKPEEQHGGQSISFISVLSTLVVMWSFCSPPSSITVSLDPWNYLS